MPPSCLNCGEDFEPAAPGSNHDHGNEVCDQCWHDLYDNEED